MTQKDQDTSLVERILDALDVKTTGRITTRQLRMLERIVASQTESDEVRKYRIKLRFYRDIILVVLLIAFLAFVFLVGIDAIASIHRVAPPFAF